MSNVNLFEAATRGRYRFPFRGLIAVEDLWDLSMENLDVVYQALEAEAEQMPRKSLFKTASAVNEVLENKIAIVRHIAEVKQSEAEARKLNAVEKERRQKIMALIDKKRDEDLRGKSIEELQKMLAD